MVRDHGNPRIAVVLFQDGYRFIYILYCMLCQDGDCDVTVRALYGVCMCYVCMHVWIYITHCHTNVPFGRCCCCNSFCHK